jgi:hypothetical protein
MAKPPVAGTHRILFEIKLIGSLLRASCFCADGSRLNERNFARPTSTASHRISAAVASATIRCPDNFVSQRRRLRFVYFDGTNLRALSYAEHRGETVMRSG